MAMTDVETLPEVGSVDRSLRHSTHVTTQAKGGVSLRLRSFGCVKEIIRLVLDRHNLRYTNIEAVTEMKTATTEAGR
jgi:hypothetical protein